MAEKIHVLGAGLAGMVAAINLARSVRIPVKVSTHSGFKSPPIPDLIPH